MPVTTKVLFLSCEGILFVVLSKCLGHILHYLCNFLLSDSKLRELESKFQAAQRQVRSLQSALETAQQSIIIPEQPDEPTLRYIIKLGQLLMRVYTVITVCLMAVCF